ncbi:hypothetical protein OB919_18355 [Halobacteria archaeon AArc-curdl1]|uniref:DUF7978 domain-containing protein n=1 Tax=Natronosalvus hydrolyticus TaxID=2979988 RepID=A0AAP2ZBB1_9EURY|nr:hypothetical protein [Halobacteria archaeon AArc-curdl1]
MGARDGDSWEKGDSQTNGGNQPVPDSNASKYGERAENRYQGLLEATLAGALAWVLGVFITFVTARSTIRNDLRTEIIESVTGDSLTTELVIWTYFNAHTVPTAFPQEGVFRLAQANQNVVLEGTDWEPMLLIVPPIVLALAGFVVARREARRVDAATLGDLIATGGVVTVGYLVVTITAMTVGTVTVGDAIVRPDPTEAVVRAGLVYPLLFGGIGGALTWLLE